MSNEIKHLREFGKFRLDTEKRVLWFESEPVNLQLKEIEVLCVLTENVGEVVTKDEILNRVWADSFVEESNLSRRIYRLRQMFKDFGEPEDLIQTVPRRGYRFTGVVHKLDRDELVIEKHSLVRTLIEEVSDDGVKPIALPDAIRRTDKKRFLIAAAVSVVLLVTLFAVWRYQKSSAKTSLSEIKSIAVLPLKSFVASKEDEELRLRITDALITKLGNLNEISVRPTNSVLRFANTDEDAVEIGRKLGVDAVLDGREQTENNHLRVTVQLVSVHSGEQIWSEQFDGQMGEILALQDAISNRLRQKFAFAETEKFSRRPTENNAAFEAYLKGRYFWNQRTPDSYFKAIGYFEEAVRDDPNFALAYSGLADSYVLLNRRYVASSEEALPKASEAARKAVALDDSLAEAHTSLALVQSTYDHDWQAAETHYRRAIELNPNYALAYGWYGMLLSGQGRFEEAETELRRAERLDPTSRNIAVYLTVNYYCWRQFDRAAEQARKTLELDSKVTTAYLYLSQSLEQQEMYDRAVEADLERQKIIAPETVEPLREAFLTAGIKGFWRKQVEIRKSQIVKYSTCPYEIATRYVLLGEKAEALNVIEENALAGGTCWNAIKVEPTFDRLREEPRFQEILRKMNLSD